MCMSCHHEKRNESSQINESIRRVKAEMKEKGIKRVSCFNGGHTPESYRLNAELFRLETLKNK